MALTISVPTKNNEVATYLRVEQIRNKEVPNNAPMFPAPAPRSQIVVTLWKDAATRQAAKDAHTYIPLQSDNLNTDAVFSDIPSAYVYLKTLDAFKGATDC